MYPVKNLQLIIKNNIMTILYFVKGSKEIIVICFMILEIFR